MGQTVGEYTRAPWYGYIVLVAGVLVHLCLGSVYCWGNMTTYVTSYLRDKHSGTVYSDSLWVYLLATTGQASTMPLGGKLQQTLGIRTTCFLGCTIFVLGVWLTKYSVAQGVGPLIGTYGLMLGAGLGIVYTCPMAAAISYLPHLKGFINGVVVMGFGLGAFCANFIITGYVNPHNCKPQCPGVNSTYPLFTCNDWPLSNSTEVPDCDGKDKYFPPTSQVSSSVPELFAILGMVYGICMFVGTCLIVPQGKSLMPQLSIWHHLKNQVDEEADEENGEASRLVKDEAEEPHAFGYEATTSQMVRTQLAWHLWVGFLLTGSGGGFILGQYKTFGQKSSWSTDAVEAHIASAMSVGNALGRLFHGSMADKFGFSVVLIACSIVASALQATLSVTHISEYWFSSWCVAVAFVYGANFALYPTGVVQLFGRKSFPANYGFVFTGFGVGSLIVGLLNKTLVNTIGFAGMTIITASITFLGAINIIFMNRKIAALQQSSIQ